MKKILLIEDNEALRSNTAEILELSNYAVVTAENGKVGVAKALKEKPDLIICDIMMPELDGYGVLHAIQRNDEIKHTPFIFLTAKAERNEMRKGMELGADDYIPKPFDGTELLNAVNSRIKKIELLKEEITPGINGVHALLRASSGRNVFDELTRDRDVNRYKKKQTIYAEGYHPHSLYFILKGKVKVFRTNEDGKELVTEIYTEGDFVGHIALLEQTTYKDTAETLEETELAVVPKEDFDELSERNPEIAKKFVKLLAKNVSEKEEQMLRIAYNSLRRKVADALITIFTRYNPKREENFSIDISRETLATIAGTATESLIRTLTDFKHENLIEIKEGRIKIPDLKKLERLLN